MVLMFHLRQLLTHTSGIRHYQKKHELEESKSGNKNGTSPPPPEEVYLNKKYKSTSDALELFKNDELINEPGENLFLVDAQHQLGRSKRPSK